MEKMEKNEEQPDWSLKFSFDKRGLFYREYKQLREDYLELDKKIIQMIFLNSAVMGFFITYILNKNFILDLSSIIIFFVILTNIGILLSQYIPQQFNIISIPRILKENIQNKEDYFKFNNGIAKAYSNGFSEIKNICSSKSRMIQTSFILLIIEIFLIFLLFVFNYG